MRIGVGAIIRRLAVAACEVAGAVVVVSLVFAGFAVQTALAGTEAATTGTGAEARVEIRARIHPSLPEMRFTLVGEPAADGLLHVHAIEVRREGSDDIVQRIGGLDTETPSDTQSPGLDLLDLDFDGYADLRLIERRPAGPNVIFRHWLYEPKSGRFVAKPALDRIVAPTPDPASRELRSDWRDGAATYGTDFYVWRGGQPRPIRRETRRYTAPGVYALQRWRFVDGRWKLVEKRQGRDS